MAKLLEIVEEINDAIISAQLSSKKFQKGRFNAIAELVVFKDKDIRQTVPVITDNSGTSVRLNMDDIYPFELYHRHLTNTFKEIPESDYGDRRLRTEVYNMKMIVIGDRQELKLTKEEITTVINLGMPMEMPQAFLETNSLRGVNIEPGTWDMDFEKVYREEYNTEEVNLTPSDIFIALDYTIETSVFDTCIEVCSE